VRVTQQVIEQPSTITVKQIDGETNAEVRRVLIERYGQVKFLQDGGAEVVHQDDWGTLYRRDMQDDEPLVMVKVVNSTREPDGSYRDYFLRVPPTVRTAREAVAWTFGQEAEQYAPRVET
jgi:hypothetical protein